MSGYFNAVPDSAKELLANAHTKDEWYAAMDALHIENAPQLGDEDELEGGWIEAMAKASAPLNLMFAGDLRAEQDDSDGPDVVFLGRDLVHDIAIALMAHDEAYFRDLLDLGDGFDRSGSLWLLPPLREFFSVTASRAEGMIIYWLHS